MIKKWKKISSKQVFSHPRHTVFIDKVMLPSGQETEYLRFGDSINAAMVIAKSSDGKFLLQQEYSYPPDEIMYQFPGGAVNSDENPITGALRELGEESGITGNLYSLGEMYVNNRRSKEKMYFFVAIELKNVDKKTDPEEFIENFWFTEEEIDMLIANDKLNNYTALSGWAFYKAKKQKLSKLGFFD